MDISNLMKVHTLENKNISLKIMEQGATVNSLKFCGKETVMSYGSEKEYEDSNTYCCRIVGRYGNRIGGAKINIEGKTYKLSKNEGDNILHGGFDAIDKRMWDVIEKNDNHITLGILMPDGENGFPGNLSMKLTYTLLESGIRLDFYGKTDKTTVFAPTFHPYFLNNNARIMINASGHLQVDSKLIPTGKILPCEDAFDFSEYKGVPDFLDDAFVVEGEHALSYKNNDYIMDVFSDFPAVQIYSQNPMGVAIEPEFYPDSPNHNNFPDTTLRPNEEFHRYMEFVFKSELT